MQVYLDNAATTPLDDEVISAMQEFMRVHYGNPSSVHAKGREARVEIEKSRKKIASTIGSKDKEIIFTSGGTEANNAILKSIALGGNIERIISSPIEHHSILDSLKWIKENTDTEIAFVSVNEEGNIDKEELKHLLEEKIPTLVSLMHANNEIGNILDIAIIGDLCHQNNALFHSDMVQTLGHLPISLNKLPIDYATASSHKLHGPKGIGFIYINSKTAKLNSYLHGGAQERSIRGGTENGSAIIGMGKAYELASDSKDSFKSHTLSLKKHAIDQISINYPSIGFNGDSANLQSSLTNILNLRMPGNYDETLIFNLDLQGVYISEGSACSSGASEGSHVIKAINTNNSGNSIRLSFSKLTSKEDVNYAIKIIGSTLTLG